MAFVVFVFSTASCSVFIAFPPGPLTPQPISTLAPIIGLQRIVPAEATKLSEIAQFVHPDGSPVAALMFTPDMEKLLALHAPSGILSHWSIAEQTLLASYNVGPVGIAAAMFDAEAQYLVTGAGQTEAAVEAGLAATFKGWRLYDAQTGAFLSESAPPGVEFILPVTDVAISSDGAWVGETKESGFFVSGLAPGIQPVSEMIVRYREDYATSGSNQAKLTAVAFDPTGEWLYFADDYGNVDYQEWRTGRPSGNFSTGAPGAALAVATDPTRRYLAAVTTQALSFMQIQAHLWSDPIPKLHFFSIPTPAAGLAFSPDGELLVVGTEDGWQVWDTAKAHLLKEVAQSTYTVAFSPDGYLLAIGDTAGVIHLWGVAEK